jgi:hypothetical protein
VRSFREMRNYIFVFVSLIGRNGVEDIGVDGSIIFECI